MSTFEKCPKQVYDMAAEILRQFETHEPLVDAGVTIDFVFAYGAKNDDGETVGDALAKNGVKALGRKALV